MDPKTKETFLELLRYGLWEESYEKHGFNIGDADWNDVIRLLQEQTVLGLVAAGLEQSGVEIPQTLKLELLGQAMLTERRNREVNGFLARLGERLCAGGIEFVVVKGQAVAQCYQRPLWRTCGDIDLLLSADNYERAKALMVPMASDVCLEDARKMHLSMRIEGIEVELHGRMPFELSGKAEVVIDEVINDTLHHGGASTWRVGDTNVLQPNPDNHLFLVFTHLLHHFFIEGVGLRQVCDWCRMLWTYRETLDLQKLESRVRRAGLMSEWQVFGAMAVEHLGMPADAMPFYEGRAANRRKAQKVLNRILGSGNFGHSRDLSYRTRYTGAAYKAVALWRRAKDFASLVPVFPSDAPRFMVTYAVGKGNRGATGRPMDCMIENEKLLYD